MRSIIAACGVSTTTTKRRFPGVYERNTGRWAADFWDHRLKVRQWLGTFPSEEEAKAAYDDFKLKLRASHQRDASAVVLPSPADLRWEDPHPHDDNQLYATTTKILVDYVQEEDLAGEDDFIGLADLGHLPLPFLDGNTDDFEFDLVDDPSLFHIEFTR
ncbi:hypothetical protein ABZP36_026472 [Zizania latifolia]